MTKKEFFAKRGAYKRVYANMKAAHPDYSASKLHAITKSIVDR